MRFAICNLILIVAVGCTSHAKRGQSEAPSPISATSQPTLRPAILYHRTGGIAGTDDRVIIWPDGQVSVRGQLLGAGEARLSENDLAKLHALFDGFENLKSDYRFAAADTYDITITYGCKTVIASDLSPALPEVFRRVYTAIEALAAQTSASTPSAP